MVEQLLRMSLTASIVILFVLIIRAFMRKLPKKFSYMLWAAVGFRLLCPVSIESKFSILNAKPAVKATEQIERSQVYANYIRHTSPAVRMQMAAHSVPEVQVTETAAKAPSVDIYTVMLVVWAVVAALIVGYAVYHLVRLKIKMRSAKEVEKGIYESSAVTSPFAMGLIRPGIYLPVDLPESEREYLIEHERTHIRRGDLVFKMIAVTALAIHWFNPLVWVAFVLFCRDMEMSCDEIVLEKLGVNIRKDYSLSLVTLASKSQDYSYVVMPTSFSKSSVGKTEVKMRIKNIMNFKKSSRSVAALAGMLVIAVMLTCVLNACAPAKKQSIESITTEKTTASQIEEETSSSEETSALELEGMDEYMMLRSECGSVDMEEGIITDIRIFENDDIRELAQDYMDKGYTLYNLEAQNGLWMTLGDYDYIFVNGFLAINNDTYDQAWVYEMNETLFEYYLVEWYDYYSDVIDEVEDDGTVIRYIDNSYRNSNITTSEFNRETGIGILSMEQVINEALCQITADNIAEVENEAFRDAAQSYLDRGFYVTYVDIIPTFGTGFGTLGYPYGYGISGIRYYECIGIYYYVFECDEDRFEALIDSGTIGPEASRETNGSVTRVTIEESLDTEWFSTFARYAEYDSELGIVTILFEDPFNNDLVSQTITEGDEDDFNDIIADGSMGEEVLRLDDGVVVTVIFEKQDGDDAYTISAEYNRDSGYIVVDTERR